MPTRLSRSQVDAVREGAAQVLLGNLKRGRDPGTMQDFAYVCPSRDGYPWQWFWDSCFHAIALCHVDLDLAKAELRQLWAAQRPDGFIPHVIHWGARFIADVPAYWQSKLSWRPKATALIQPPVLAQAALYVAERSQDKTVPRRGAGPRPPLLSLAPRQPGPRRRPPDLGHQPPTRRGWTICPPGTRPSARAIPPGWACRPATRLLDLHNLVLGRNYNLDAIFRRDRFNVEDVALNCMYAQGLRSVARLFAMAGSEPERDSFIKMAERTEEQILAKCFDASTETFWGLSGRDEQPLKVLTVASLLPLLLESIDTQRLDALVERHLTSEGAFWLTYPVPSVARSEPSFRPQRAFPHLGAGRRGST